MVCLIHWAILYDFGSRHFSFNPSPFYDRLLSERGLFCRVSCTRGVPAACCSGPLFGHGRWYRTNLCLHHCRTGLRNYSGYVPIASAGRPEGECALRCRFFAPVRWHANTFYLCGSLLYVYRCPEARFAMKKISFCNAQYLSIREGDRFR